MYKQILALMDCFKQGHCRNVDYMYIQTGSYCSLYVGQPVARGHRAYTDLSAASIQGPGGMHRLQPCQLYHRIILHKNFV